MLTQLIFTLTWSTQINQYTINKIQWEIAKKREALIKVFDLSGLELSFLIQNWSQMFEKVNMNFQAMQILDYY
ncbi:hypothetical protein BpHYR1_052794 [Brachionus plicatilis]|uniref:Uncharacterized protein n=1 Tax=Brachionus plicatilis TaxID=10195 RepID=A0A3M7T0Y0_BRAPC|nr:hypothetical protein BpHYR1_052794 [Brachionus plicatilis]